MSINGRVRTEGKTQSLLKFDEIRLKLKTANIDYTKICIVIVKDGSDKE